MVDAIVEAAALLLVRFGPDTTTNAIAERAGVSVGSLYRYFENKAAIFDAVSVEYARNLSAESERLLAEGKTLPLRTLVLELAGWPHRLEQCYHPGLGARLNAMRHAGRAFPAIDAFEREQEDRAVALFIAKTGGRLDHSVAASAARVMCHAYIGAVRMTLATAPEELAKPRFQRVLRALASGFAALVGEPPPDPEE